MTDDQPTVAERAAWQRGYEKGLHDMAHDPSQWVVVTREEWEALSLERDRSRSAIRGMLCLYLRKTERPLYDQQTGELAPKNLPLAVQEALTLCNEWDWED